MGRIKYELYDSEFFEPLGKSLGVSSIVDYFNLSSDEV